MGYCLSQSAPKAGSLREHLIRQAETDVVMMRWCRICGGGGGAFSPPMRMSDATWHLSLGAYLELFLASRAYRNGAPTSVCSAAMNESSASSTALVSDVEGTQTSASVSSPSVPLTPAPAATLNDGIGSAGASNKLDAPAVTDGGLGTPCNHRLFSDMDHLFAHKNGLITFRFVKLSGGIPGFCFPLFAFLFIRIYSNFSLSEVTVREICLPSVKLQRTIQMTLKSLPPAQEMERFTQRYIIVHILVCFAKFLIKHV